MKSAAPQPSARVCWLTGLSGAGKSTLCKLLVARLRTEGRCVVMLDGDELREVMAAEQAHTRAERLALALRYARLCQMLAKQGLDVAIATISLFKEVHAWKVAGGGHFVVDEVLGKHEFITYAVGLNPDGTVRQIEIMDYRESYGHQIRDAEWRRQFSGKSAAAPLKLERDIRNISGATLSCRHITDGIKRVLATHDIALR